MQHLTSTSTTTTTTTTTTSTTTKPFKKGKREIPDDARDYFYDAVKSFREDDKVFIGARGYWPYKEDEYSTTAWVEHQFMEVISI